MEILKLVIQISILLFASISSLAQSYFANGNAKAVGGSCYQLTSATDWQLGSVWYADKLDLSRSEERRVGEGCRSWWGAEHVYRGV